MRDDDDPTASLKVFHDVIFELQACTLVQSKKWLIDKPQLAVFELQSCQCQSALHACREFGDRQTNLQPVARNTPSVQAVSQYVCRCVLVSQS